MKIQKASGDTETFNPRKIYKTLIEAGAQRQLAQEIADQVRGKAREGITSQKILEIVLNRLKNHPGIAARYDLKRAVMSLGPSGFPFERYFADILKHHGYSVSVGNHVKGKRIMHEIDVIAKNKNKSFMIECKYHNEPGKPTKLQPAMYTYARFLDLTKRLDQPWLATNTKCSKDAKEYAIGVGLKVTSWRYPEKESLIKLIEAKKLYPITILKNIDNKTRNKLFQADIVLAKNLQNYTIAQIQEKTELSEKQIKRILNELSLVLS
jgi:AF1548-like protein/ATP cone domain-containing protein/restriction endonuclease